MMSPYLSSSPTRRVFLDCRIAFLSFVLLAMSSHAEPLLEAIFNDPEGTFTQEVSAAAKAPFRGKNIATCDRGKAIPVIALAPQDAPQAPEQHVQMLAEPPMSGPFFRASQQGGTFGPQTYCGVEITPEHDGASLAALSSVGNDTVVLDGAFDLFFRASQEPTGGAGLQFKIMDGSARDGFRFVFSTNRNNSGLSASLIRQGTNFFDTDLDGKADTQQVSTDSAAGSTSMPIESGKIYHAAVAFSTAANGLTSMRVFLKEGLGAIDTKKTDDLNGEVKFRIINTDGKLKNGLSADKITLGTFPARPIAGMNFSLDLAAFRIFKPEPGEFSALAK